MPDAASILSYPRHLLSTVGLGAADAMAILDLAQSHYARNQRADKKHPVLKGRTHINLFFENSTRTRTSFELAGKRLGMDVINISAAASSVKKGESLLDTAKTLDAMNPDVVVMRHAGSGAATLVARHINAKLINAGDGSHQHPTQALLDAFTIRHHKKEIEGLTVAICGDIAGSRVARSNIALLHTLGAKVRLVAPPTLMPSQAHTLGCELSYHMKDGLADADVVMMLRIQYERMSAGGAVPSVREYFHLYGLDYEKLKAAKPDALVMHPGPMNRGVEISGELADDVARSAILDQVESGVAVRMAILEKLLS